MDYKRVIEDFNDGTIDPSKYQVIMDDDGGYWLCIDSSIDDDAKREALADKMEKNMVLPLVTMIL